MAKLTIVICTYNRSEFIEKCLESFLSQSVSQRMFDILVVDNNSSDNTKEIVDHFVTKLPNLRYTLEPIQGLSHARNAGIVHTRTEWICYLDDDAYVPVDFIEVQLKIIEENNFDVYGGVYLPWFKYGKPKWFHERYGSNKMHYNRIVELKSHEYLSGGIISFKKELLETFSGFKTNLGMVGEIIGYGEETELQNRIRKAGIPIYYIPSLIIYHVVQEYKLDVKWHLTSAFNLGKHVIIMNKLKRKNYIIFSQLILLIISFLIEVFKNTPKLLSPNYYFENWLIDSFRKPLKRLSILVELMNNNALTVKKI